MNAAPVWALVNADLGRGSPGILRFRGSRILSVDSAVQRDDLAPFEALLSVLERPFEDQPGRERHAAPPEPEQRVLRTFCGT